MKNSKSTRQSLPTAWWIWLLIIAMPVIIGSSWGTQFQDYVYRTLRVAHSFAMDSLTSSIRNLPGLAEPFFILILSMPARLGIDLLPVAALISLLGWSATALAFLNIGAALQRPFSGLVAASLLVFNPWIITTLGQITSWQIALIWIINALVLRRRFILLFVAAALLFLTLFSRTAETVGYNLANLLPPFIWSALLFFGGLGADWLANWLSDQDIIRLNSHQAKSVLLIALFLLFGSFQAVRLWQLYQLRPSDVWQLESDMAEWIRTNTSPTAALFASEKIAYLSQRQLAGLFPEGVTRDHNETLKIIRELEPDLVIVDHTLPWQYLVASTWFQLAYQPLQQFTTADALSTRTIWAARPQLDGYEPRQTINARIPDHLKIVGYQFGSAVVDPGDDLELALYIQNPEATNQPLNPYTALVRLVSPVNNELIAEWRIELPQAAAADLWQPGEVIVEQFSLPLPDELDFGAYNLNISFFDTDASELWPISLDNDMNRLDRVLLGNVLLPWHGSLESAHPYEANFDDQIDLIGYELNHNQADSMSDVRLYWQANTTPDADYTVFVHILDESGNLVASHDSRPANGRFPTTTWRPEMIIPDTHPIQWPSSLPSGEYTILVGLYLPETGERLTILNDVGEATADRANIDTITIP